MRVRAGYCMGGSSLLTPSSSCLPSPSLLPSTEEATGSNRLGPSPDAALPASASAGLYPYNYPDATEGPFGEPLTSGAEDSGTHDPSSSSSRPMRLHLHGLEVGPMAEVVAALGLRGKLALAKGVEDADVVLALRGKVRAGARDGDTGLLSLS